MRIWRPFEHLRHRCGPRAAGPTRQSRTTSRRGRYISVTVAVVAAAATAAAGSPWPSFLPPASDLPADVVARVQHVWRDPTLTRTVHGEPARVPFDVYAALVDAPVVTAEAARHLHLAAYTVRQLDADTYEADDGNGAHGRYRVLVRERTRRVILSWGRHRGQFLGTVSGSALTVMEFEDRDGAVEPQLTTYVRIDNTAAALLARVLVTVFGSVADRRLSEGFATTAKVAEWSMSHADEFCAWFRQESPDEPGAERVSAAVGRCAVAALTPPRRSPHTAVHATRPWPRAMARTRR